MRYITLTVLVGSCFLPFGARADSVDFTKEIRPILSSNCLECHGPDERARKARLRLDLPDEAARVLADSDQEPSILLQRVITTDPEDRMPPPASGKELSPEEIDLLRQWIEGGAVYERHWAFEKPRRSLVPGTRDLTWPLHPIDSFILQRLEAQGLTPSPQADAATLVRRVWLDLVGLPPSPEAVSAFVADPSDSAYERIVDDLLASPHFGERWARHWLDLARYADSNGYSIDGERSIWPYRDWVINAINGNMPFDQFVIEQLAGDLLPGATLEQRVATGFHRNTMINQEGGIDPEEFRVAQVIDRVNTTATVFLGLTMGCAQCHTHKYDPIQHTEYYKFLAFFNSDDEPDIEVADVTILADRARIKGKIADEQSKLAAYLISVEATEQAEWEKGLTLEFIGSLPIETRVAFVTARDERNDVQREAIRKEFQQHSPTAQDFLARIEELTQSLPNVPTTMVLAARNEPRETHVFEQGDFTRPADVVTPGVPAVLHSFPEDGGGTRLDLAHWLVLPDNPLTARVTVNRMWQRLFGAGIVETENDFGTQGALPTHPELLDWLAVEFVESGWDMKHVIKSIVMSATYRQASTVAPNALDGDPLNKLLSRQNRLRLDAEIIRDSALGVSGLLNPTIGGAPVYPLQPEGVMGLGQRLREWKVSNGADKYRRGMYTFFWRGTPYPSLTVFDAPNAQMACTRRARSNTPLQALTLLNDGAFVELAAGLAARLCTNDAQTDEDRIQQAFRLCLSRAPEDEEVDVLLDLIASEREALEGSETAEQQAWVSVARAMLNLDEFITRE